MTLAEDKAWLDAAGQRIAAACAAAHRRARCLDAEGIARRQVAYDADVQQVSATAPTRVPRWFNRRA